MKGRIETGANVVFLCRLWRVGIFAFMSTEAQFVLEQIRALPISDQHALLRELEQCVGHASAPVAGELYGKPLTDEDIEQSSRVTFRMFDDEEKRAEQG
jgi:hypothetical protein